MSQKIRIGNDIGIQWSLLDAQEQPYVVEGRDVAIELNVGNHRVKITDFSLSGNVISFTYYGKDQRLTGSYALKYIENGGQVDMVTFDTKDAFTLVEHSWLALDEGETPETIQIEVVTVSSELDSKAGPRGYSAYEIAVQNGFIGTEEEWLASLVGPPGPPGVGTTYLDAYFNVVEDGEQVMLTYDHGEVTEARLDEIIGEGGMPCLNVYINEAEEGEEPSWAPLVKAVYDGVAESSYYAFRAGNSFINDISIIFVDDEGWHGYGTITYYQLLALFSNAIEPIEEVIPEEASSSNKLADKAYVDARVSIATDEEIHALFNA